MGETSGAEGAIPACRLARGRNVSRETRSRKIRSRSRSRESKSRSRESKSKSRLRARSTLRAALDTVSYGRGWAPTHLCPDVGSSSE